MTRFSEFEGTEKLALYDAINYAKKEMWWSQEEGKAIKNLKKEIKKEVQKA